MKIKYFYCSVKGDSLYVNCIHGTGKYIIHKGGDYSDENVFELYEMFEGKCVNFMYKYFLTFAPIVKENFLCEVFGKTQLKFW